MGKVELWQQIAGRLEAWRENQSDAHLRESVDGLLVEYMVDYREKLRIREEAAEKKRVSAASSEGAKRAQQQREWSAERTKMVWRMREEGMSLRKIAKLIERSAQTVRVILYREERHRKWVSGQLEEVAE